MKQIYVSGVRIFIPLGANRRLTVLSSYIGTFKEWLQSIDAQGVIINISEDTAYVYSNFGNYNLYSSEHIFVPISVRMALKLVPDVRDIIIGRELH
jgi:hypothetical protein